MSDWLRRYYGTEYDFLNPEVIKEGKKWAVVRLNRRASKGFSSVGHVLIKKAGSHVASPYISLHEGIPTTTDLDTMYKKLTHEDANG